MKKVIIIITAIISVITLSSCGNNVKEQRLIEMRDSIQAEIDWKSAAIDREFQEIDSLFKADFDKYSYMHDRYMSEIDMLREMIDEDNSKLFQIELELNK